MIIKFHVDSLEAQKDEYAPKHKNARDDWEFESAKDRNANFIHFKRFVISCRIEVGGSTYPVTVLISMRGSDSLGYLVTIIVDDESPLPALDFYVGLEGILRNYMAHQEGGNRRRPLYVKELLDGSMRLVGVTPSAAWLTDVFHHLRDAISYQKAPIELDTSRAEPNVIRPGKSHVKQFNEQKVDL